MSCCTNKRRFCQFVHACDPQTFLDLFKGMEDGEYTVRLDYQGSYIDIPIVVIENVVTKPVDTIISLNEYYTYTGKVLDTDGQPVAYYDCFEFKTTMKYV